MKRLLLLAGGWTLLAGPGHAQDYPRIAPKAVPPVAPAAQVPATPVPKAKADGEVLLPRLKGLVFVPRPELIVKAGVSTSGVDLKHIVVPDEPDFKKLVGPYVGGKFTRGQLNHLVTDVILYYRQHDRPVVDVIVPEQDIATGTVQILVLESRVAQVAVTGPG
jgi:hemolysin activation/secretion protein